MKIAIMGAGLSGLACALTLEKHGVFPTIFEKRSQVGDRFVNAEALLPALSRPIQDTLAYCSDQLGIFLQPTANIRKMQFYSPHRQATVSGQFGFTNIRGRDSDSFEAQLFRQVHSEVVFNSDYSYEALLQQFTHVILATGDAAYTEKVQDFTTDLTVTLKGATVEGEFDPYSVAIWLDYDLAPQGYAFFIPYSHKEGALTLAYPDYPDNQKYALNDLWTHLFKRAQKDLGQDLPITDRFEVTHYMIGRCSRPRIGNTFFVGNCFGAIMPAFGFGQFASILSGVYAAQELLGLGRYEELVKPLVKSYQDSLILRRFMENLNNKNLDRLVQLLDTPLANHLLNVRKWDPLKLAIFFLRPYVRLSENKASHS